MEKMELTILGCGSALPTTRHNPSSQVLNVRDKLYMIDCGEGTQLEMRRAKLNFTRLGHIFISHLPGDHCFGLFGLISTFNLLGRTAELHIHSPYGLEELMQPMLSYVCQQLTYKVLFHPFDASKAACIFEDRSLKVTTIPLRHRLPCCGFLFEEAEGLRHILREMVDCYEVPLYLRQSIRQGADYVTPEGVTIKNELLTRPGDPARRYAYVSDTLPLPSVIPQVKGVDLLYHEATFADEETARARETFHTTASQAAQLAREAQVAHLLIGHYSARYESEEPLLAQAKAHFSATTLAQEGMKIEILPQSVKLFAPDGVK